VLRRERGKEQERKKRREKRKKRREGGRVIFESVCVLN
jgi:hypothetical protein